MQYFRARKKCRLINYLSKRLLANHQRLEAKKDRDCQPAFVACWEITSIRSFETLFDRLNSKYSMQVYRFNNPPNNPCNSFPFKEQSSLSDNFMS